MDIDIDISPSKRELIFQKIREERGQFGCVQVCTFGTETTKNAIQTACRGMGIDVDESKYLASLIPEERGFLWPINDVLNGNPEKDRKPVKSFINRASQYPGLIDVIVKIEGLIVSRGIHASGVNFYGDDPYDTACFMKSKNGAVITQYSLHDCEYCGDVKLDFLVTEQMDIIGECLTMLQEHGHISKDLTLKEAYDSTISPEILPIEDDKMWNLIDSTNLLALFQFNTSVGGQVVRQLQPRNLEELTACNALTRLTGEKGAERPADRYSRMKKDISQWYAEMDMIGLTKDEQKIMEKYCLEDYGTPNSQEKLMLILMDEGTCNFSLAEANTARKICAKKQMSKIPWLKNEVLTRAPRKIFGEYIWRTAIEPSMSYSFSRIHGYSYSIIACQGAYLATAFPSIYWNTAYLRVVSGLDNDDSSNYEKIAKGLGEILSHNINVSLVDINESGYMFEPDESKNTILYGLKAVSGINGNTIEEILANRPYDSFSDFVNKNNFSKTVILSLIKAGAFDYFDDRESIMDEYVNSICDFKTKINMQNFNYLVEHNLIPDEFKFQKQVFSFNKLLTKNCRMAGGYIKIENVESMRFYDFFEKFFDINKLTVVDNHVVITEKDWKKIKDAAMMPVKQWILDNQKDLINKVNSIIYDDAFLSCADGSISDWEMDSVGFYYSEHPLLSVNSGLYNLSKYSDMNESPIVKKTGTTKDGRVYTLFKTSRICGTVIAKDDRKSMITILTPYKEVVSVKFYKDFYARLNAQLSEVGKDGKKHVIEKSWFNRGTHLIINGFRRDNTFVARAYKKDGEHQVYKITEIKPNGLLEMTYLRPGEESD